MHLTRNAAFSAAQKSATLLDPHGSDVASDYLNIHEVAVLTSNDSAALNWLDLAAQQTKIEPGDESLVRFYRLWIEMRHGQAKESVDSEARQEAPVRFRKANHKLNWMFDGVKYVLAKEKLAEGNAQLLEEMTEAMEDNAKPLPSRSKLSSATAYRPTLNRVSSGKVI